MTKSVFFLGAIAALTLGGCGSSSYYAPSPYTQRPIDPMFAPAAVRSASNQTLTRATPGTEAPRGYADASRNGAVAAEAALLTPPVGRGTPPLRVMSFNLRTPFILDGLNHWGFRKDLTAQTIARFAPDILGTQECTSDQAAYIQAALPGYGFVGAGRDDGRQKGEMAAIFWRSDRFAKVDAGHFWLSETPERIGSKGWDAGWRRVCTWVKLQERTTGRLVVMFNTHFDVWGDEARFRSAHLIRERIATIAAGLPTLVTGDFNCDEDSAPYRALVSDALLDDTFRDANPRDQRHEGTRHGFDGSAGDTRIDWILATAGFDTLAAGIDRTRFGSRYPSDHFPVTAVLQFNDREAAILRSAAARAAVDPNGG